MKSITPLCLVLLLGIGSSTYAQESKYKALFLFNFTKYIEWSGDKVTIGVIGNSPVLLELESLVRQNSKIELLKISGTESIDQCDMIFLPEAQTRNFDLIQEKITKGTLIVAENELLIPKGAEMAFYMEGDKLRFIVNKPELDAGGINMSSTLLAKAKIVN